MRRLLIACTIGLVTAVIGAGIALSPLGDELEKNVGLPWLFSIRGPIEAPRDIVLVGINSASGRRMGLPDLPRNWPRSLHGLLVRSLTEAGASVIAFDMAFMSPREAGPDRAFARDIANSNRVVLIQLLTGKRQAVTDRTGRNTGFVWVEHIQSPLPIFAEAARGLAPWPLPKQQVTVHQFWSFKPSAGDTPTLPGVALQLHAQSQMKPWNKLMRELGVGEAQSGRPADKAWANPQSVRDRMTALRRTFRDDPTLAGRMDDAIRESRPGALSAQQQKLFRALAGLYAGSDNRFLNFYGPPGSIKTIPFEVMIKGGDVNHPPETLDVKNKIVFVGFSDLDDPGQPDRFYTVFTRDDGVDLSGVEIAATALGNLMQNRTLQQSDILTTIIAILVFGFVISLLVYLLPAVIAVATALVVAGAYAVGVQYEFTTAAHWLPLANPMLIQLPLALLLGLLGQYFLERRQQRLVRATLARYVDPAVTDRLIAGGVDVLGGRETTTTILFSDMRGFTSVSEALGPQGTVKLLNEYFTLMVDCITSEGGMLDKFIGDAIMAAFGVPVEHEDDADRAVRASIEMLRRLDGWNLEREARGELQVNIGIGLNTDIVVSGNIGSPKRMDFTLIGDGVNLAARLESACKQYSANLLVSEYTYNCLRGTYVSRDVDEVIVVGKSEPVRVYELLDHYSEEKFPNATKVIERFVEGRKFYKSGNWDEAMTAFRSGLSLNPGDRLSEIYIERCEFLKNNSPEDWDGVWQLESK
jgi:adenylate cyclase